MALDKKKKKQYLEVNCLNVCLIFFGFRLTFVKNILCLRFSFFLFSC